MSVALGAFGAHALKASLPANLLATFNTAVNYQMSHSLALLLVVLLAKVFSGSSAKDADITLRLAASAFTIGILLFSGSLYALALSGQTMFGAITPLGGLCFLFGWAALFLFAFKKAN